MTAPEKTLVVRWVEALESGEYPQDPAGGYLKTERGFCCLGVLADVKGAEWIPDPDFPSKIMNLDGSYAMPTPATILALGLDQSHLFDHDINDLNTVFVTRDDGTVTGVHQLNDQGVSFQEIARLIRRTYPEAFAPADIPICQM